MQDRHNSNETSNGKINQEGTKQKCRLGTASNEITGGLQLVCGRPTLALSNPVLKLMPVFIHINILTQFLNDLSYHFKKIIVRYKKLIITDVLRQTACLIVNPIRVHSFAHLVNSTTEGRASG